MFARELEVLPDNAPVDPLAANERDHRLRQRIVHQPVVHVALEVLGPVLPDLGHDVRLGIELP